MPIPFNVGHCRGITERFKSQIQHNSNYVVFSDSGKACYISPVGSIGRSTKTERTAREQQGKIIKAVRKPRRSMNEAREN